MDYLTLPYSACVILRPSNNCVAFVVESTTEYLIRVTFQDLKTVTCLSLPHSSCFVRGCSKDPAPLGVEGYFRDLTLVTRQDRMTSTSHCIIHTRVAISWGCDELWSSGVEGHVQDFIIMSSEGVYARTTGYIPHLAGPVTRLRHSGTAYSHRQFRQHGQGVGCSYWSMHTHVDWPSRGDL